MQPFAFSAAREPKEAMAASDPGDAFIAGGTDLLQLLKDGVVTPRRLVDISGLPWRGVQFSADGVTIGALTRMGDAGDDARLRQDYPVISEALLASASPQVRNLATIGGNLMQRTRCLYFRDVTTPCNKRQPRSGCAAMDGQNRANAILGGSLQCIATHASDLAVALAALDAQLRLSGLRGDRQVALTDFHRLPGDTPHLESVLEPGELITAVFVPAGPHARRSTYLKVRDRASFEWALTSAAVALDMNGGAIRHARVAVGGVGTKPWRLPKVEQALVGARIDRASLAAATDTAGQGAQPRPYNAFKVDLMKRTIVRALFNAGGIA